MAGLDEWSRVSLAPKVNSMLSRFFIFQMISTHEGYLKELYLKEIIRCWITQRRPTKHIGYLSICSYIERYQTYFLVITKKSYEHFWACPGEYSYIPLNWNLSVKVYEYEYKKQYKSFWIIFGEQFKSKMINFPEIRYKYKLA